MNEYEYCVRMADEHAAAGRMATARWWKTQADQCLPDTVPRMRPAVPSVSDAAILVASLHRRDLAIWDGLCADDIVRVIMTCWQAGVDIPERGSEAFGSAVAGDVEGLR